MIKGYRGIKPRINKRAFIAEGTVITGDFSLGEYSSLWYGTIARADVDKIVIGSRTNIQDGCIIHCSGGFPTIIGDCVSVGHRALVHGCTIADNCLIGMGSIIMDGAVIGEYSIIGAGALITPGKKIPPYSVVMGSPGKVVRRTSDEEADEIKERALAYAKLAKEYSGVD